MRSSAILILLTSALALASPLEKRCSANGTPCSTAGECCGMTCAGFGGAQPTCTGPLDKRDNGDNGQSGGDDGGQSNNLNKRCSANGTPCSSAGECCGMTCAGFGGAQPTCTGPLKERGESYDTALGKENTKTDKELNKRCSANGTPCSTAGECCGMTCAGFGGAQPTCAGPL